MKSFFGRKKLDFSTTKSPLYGWAAAFFIYCIVYGFRLSFPSQVYFDEMYHVQTARDMISLTHLADKVHPPLGKLLIALSILVFGDHAWAWRIPSFLCGFGVLAITYLLASKLFNSRRAGFIAVWLLGFECLSFTEARMAMFNAAMLFFALLSLYFLLKHSIWQEWDRRKSFLFSGLFFGLAMGTKWMIFAIIPVFLILWVKLFRNSPSRKEFLKDWVFFYLLPMLAAYFSTFMIILFIPGYKPWAILNFQWYMILGHWNFKVIHPNPSEWWTWPLSLHPVYYFFTEQAYVSLRAHHKISAIIGVGNIAFFWLIPFFMTFSIYRYFKKRSVQELLLITGFFSLWLQWIFLHREKFLHYYYPALPFAAISSAVFLNYLWTQWKNLRIPVIVYLLLVAVFFIYWYPLLTGVQVSGSFFRQHLWLPSWK